MTFLLLPSPVRVQKVFFSFFISKWLLQGEPKLGFLHVNVNIKIEIVPNYFFNETNLLWRFLCECYSCNISSKYTELLHLLNDFIILLTSSSPLIRSRPFKRIKSSLACHFSLVDYPVSHWNGYYSNKQVCDLFIYVDFKHTSWLAILFGRGKISVIFYIIFVC